MVGRDPLGTALAHPLPIPRWSKLGKRLKPMYGKQDMSYHPSLHHKFHLDHPGTEFGPPRRAAGQQSSYQAGVVGGYINKHMLVQVRLLLRSHHSPKAEVTQEQTAKSNGHKRMQKGVAVKCYVIVKLQETGWEEGKMILSFCIWHYWA
jgi:hypothetical protein